MNWATITGATDLVLAAFLKLEKLDMAKIPYRDPVQALNDVAEGRLQLYWAALAIVRGPMQAGRIKVLAITASKPSSVVPDIPTVTQAGFPALTFDGLVGLYGTRDMPAELRERIAADVREALTDPTIVGRLQATGRRWCRVRRPNLQPTSTSSVRRWPASPRCSASRPLKALRHTPAGGLPLSGRGAYKAGNALVRRQFRLCRQATGSWQRRSTC